MKYGQELGTHLARVIAEMVLAEDEPFIKDAHKPAKERLNAWGQDAKTAKAERKRLRQEKAMRRFMKAHRLSNSNGTV